MSLVQLFFIIQLALQLPAMADGTEVRLVSRDLLTVYASATVVGGNLTFEEFPAPGTEVRVLIFPPDAGPAEQAEALSGAAALAGSVSLAGDDVMLVDPDLERPVSLRELLLHERNVRLVLPR